MKWKRPTLSTGENGGTPAQPKTAAWWVKLLVLFHVICITEWACPQPQQGILDGKIKPFGSDYIRYWDELYLKPFTPFQLYLFTTGTWQYWDMFAPNPASLDWYGTAEVTFKDGTHKPYQFPRMYLLPIPEKYLKERFRKFYERAHDDKYSYLFPQFGLRIALLNYKNPKNPPVRVELIRHWLEVVDPGKPQATDYSYYNYYTYEVDQKQLQSLASGIH